MQLRSIAGASAIAIGLVVVSGTGGAVAGALITGAQIKNGSVTGTDIKDASIRSADVAGLMGVDVTNASLTGSDLKDGSIGSLDVTGLTGADITDESVGSADINGLTGADVADGSLSVADLGAGTLGKPSLLPWGYLQPNATWTSLPVTPGDYVVQAVIKGARASTMEGTSLTDFACALYVAGPEDEVGVGVNPSVASAWVDPGHWQGVNLPMLAKVSVPEGYTSIDLRCYGSLFSKGDITGEGTIMVTRLVG